MRQIDIRKLTLRVEKKREFSHDERFPTWLSGYERKIFLAAGVNRSHWAVLSLFPVCMKQ